MSEELTEDLLDGLGDDGFFKLVEAYGGLRLYVPAEPNRSELPSMIGNDAAIILSSMYPGGYIRVPLARDFRAVRFHRDGLGVRDIARRLGLTETGIEKLLRRARNQKRIKSKSHKDPRQIELFPEKMARPK